MLLSSYYEVCGSECSFIGLGLPNYFVNWCLKCDAAQQVSINSRWSHESIISDWSGVYTLNSEYFDWLNIQAFETGSLCLKYRVVFHYRRCGTAKLSVRRSILSLSSEVNPESKQIFFRARNFSFRVNSELRRLGELFETRCFENKRKSSKQVKARRNRASHWHISESRFWAARGEDF